MTIHLIKLCVGAKDVDDLKRWQDQCLRLLRTAGRPAEIVHETRHMPRERTALLQGGSLYWIINGLVTVRQRLLDIRATGAEGKGCALVLGPDLIAVSPVPRRPFQGWRYLKVEDAPADLSPGAAAGAAAMPAHMRAELAALGLL